MPDIVTIRAEARDRAGKGAARAVRRSGRGPGVIYGEKQPPALISLDPRELETQMRRKGFFARLLDVEVGGAKSVSAYVTHGVFSGGAVARVTASPMEAMVTTDSILATEAVRVARNIRQLSIAPLIAEAIRRISEERSVSSLFD